MIKVTIEFTNLAKAIAGTPEVTIQVRPGITFGGLVERLGQMYPDLIGTLIDADGKTFLSSNMFIINNEMSLPIMVMNETPKDGDHLTLVSIPTGG